MRLLLQATDSSSADLAPFYDSDYGSDDDNTVQHGSDHDGDDVVVVLDSDEEVGEVDDIHAAEDTHIAICVSLYDEYVALQSDALVDYPPLIDVQLNGYAQVLLQPVHTIERDDMDSQRLREVFFIYYIEELVVPAVRAILPNI